MIPERMSAVLLTGISGLEMLDYRDDVPVPRPRAGEVLVNVTAAGMNNTDVNTRTGWYNASIDSGTTEGGAAGFGVAGDGMGDWSGDIELPRIQGADAVGRIASVGDGVSPQRIGERVVCDPYIRDPDDVTGLDSAGFLGADYDGGFAQFVRVPADNAIRISDSVTLDDAAIATLPCSGGTAMNMLLMARVGAGDRMLVTGASGGVGSFLIQLGCWLGAEIIAVASASTRDAVLALGAAAVVEREADQHAAAALAAGSGGRYSVIADLVGGDRFAEYLSLLGRGGRYVTAGAIAGPIVRLDLRTLYLKNLEFYGSTVFRRETFPTLMHALESGVLDPPVGGCWPLARIRDAQRAFLQKQHVGSLVLLPEPVQGDPP